MKTIPKNELFQSGDPFKMSFSNLLSLLRDGGPFLLRAWAENSDPKLEKYQVIIDKKSQTQEELIGGLTINNTTFLFYADPSDGLRSYAETVLVLPDFELSTTLPFIPVTFQPMPIDDPTQEETAFHCLSVETGKSILDFGTEYGDEFYPSAFFHRNFQNLQLALPAATRTLLREEIGEKNSTPRPKKL